MKRGNLYFDNTLAQLNKLKHQIKLGSFVASIVAQAWFLAYYTYRIVTNLDNIVRLVIYIVLLVIAALMLGLGIAFGVMKEKNSKKNIDKGILTVKIIKYLVCFGSLGYTAYEYITIGISNTAFLFAILCFVNLMFNITLEITKRVTVAYVDTMTLSFRMDIESNAIGEFYERMGYEQIIPSEEESIKRSKIREDTIKYAPPHMEPMNKAKVARVVGGMIGESIMDSAIGATMKTVKKLDVLHMQTLLMSKRGYSKKLLATPDAKLLFNSACKIASMYTGNKLIAFVPALVRYIEENQDNQIDENLVLDATTTIDEVVNGKDENKKNKLIALCCKNIGDKLTPYIEQENNNENEAQ